MTIELERDVAQNLIETRLIRIRKMIQKILNRWNNQSAKDFLEKSRKGQIPESENDAIDLHQLLLEEEKLTLLLKKIQ